MTDPVLLDESVRRLAEHAALSHVALLAASGRPFDEVVAGATEAIQRLWPGADRLGFLFLDENGHGLGAHPSSGGPAPDELEPAAPRDRAPVEAAVGQVLRSGEALRWGDSGRAGLGFGGGAPVGSAMAAPLLVDHVTLGVAWLQSPEPESFSEADVSGLASLARQLAIVFARMRLDRQLAAERSLLDRRVQALTGELHAAQAELAQSARLKDELLAAISHELRTPLAAILGMAQALQAGLYGPLSERQLARLRTIEESGRHLLALLNHLLHWPTAKPDVRT